MKSPVLRDVIRKVLDVNYGPMSYNGEVTESILRAIEADATFVPLMTVERWTAEPCRFGFADTQHCTTHDSHWSADSGRCLAVEMFRPIRRIVATMVAQPPI